MSKANFSELTNKMSDIVSGKINNTEFINWLTKNIDVKKYIPISDKYTNIDLLSMDLEMDYLNDFISGDSKIGIKDIYKQYDMLIVFKLLMSYTDIDLHKDDRNEDNYNLIMGSGLYNYMVSICRDDFDLYKAQCDRFVGINNLSIISQLNEVFDKSPSIDEFNESIINLKKVMSSKKVSENLRFMNNTEMINNPTLLKIIDDIQKSFAKELRGKTVKEVG